MRRDDIQEKPYFRSSQRLFRVNGDWYFSAREGDQGPYPNEMTAALELERFIEEQLALQKFLKSGVKVVVMDQAKPKRAPVHKGQADVKPDTFEQLGMVI